MSETASKPGGSRLPMPRGGIPRPRPAASAASAAGSSLGSRRVTRQSLSAPDLTKIGVAAKPVQRGGATAQGSLFRKAVATAASRATQPTTAAVSRKRPAPSAQPAAGPERKKPLVQVNTNRQNGTAADKKALPSTGNAGANKRPKPAAWDIKGKLEHANEKISKLTEENEFLSNAAAEAVTTQQELEKLTKEQEALNDQLRDALAELQCVKASEQKFNAEAVQLKAELDSLKLLHDNLNVLLGTLKSQCESTKQSEEKLKAQVATMAAELDSKNSTIVSLQETVAAANLRDSLRIDQIFNEQQSKKLLLQQILDLKGNIRVFCRVRPQLPSEDSKSLLSFNFPNEAAVELKTVEKGKPEKKSFTYDKVFAPGSTQMDIYDDLSALVQSALDGYNVCVFAYGQTGSGKTHTMQGGLDRESEGMIPRAIKTIYSTIQEQNKLGWEFKVRCSFLEIYNENIRDLLNPNSNLSYEVKMVDTNSEDVFVSNLKVETVPSEEVLFKLLTKAQKNRFVAATVMNDQSSRSHSITQIKLEGHNTSKNIHCQGTLNLIDLAGSERYQSENETDRKAETVKINKSLTTLSLVVLKLAEKAEHIPFRDSKLTHLLMPSLKGNSKTLMIVNISPLEECLKETVCSLRFASRVSAVKVDSKRQIKSSMNQASSKK